MTHRTPIYAALGIALLLSFWGTPSAVAIEAEAIPITTHSRPFFAATLDLAAYGFVEEEYAVQGTADVYEYDGQGEVRIRQAALPYRSRLLIRRPTLQRFNGVVVVELLNPTAGHDIDFEWHFNRELLLGEGYAWVGITLKDVAIDYLRSWDPQRYGELSMVDNGLAYGLVAQVGMLLRDGGREDNPLAGYAVETLIATGYSQTADYLTTFSNEFHHRLLGDDGEPVYDGYLHAGGNGAARGIHSSDPNLYIDSRRFNRVEAPLIRVQSETEVQIFFYRSSTTRQPDSEHFRLYEIAGGSHADAEILQRNGEVIHRDVGLPVLPPCGEPLSPLAIGPVHRSSLELLVRWITRGEAPPPSRLLELDDDGNVLRDADGNALGGVRLPPIAVPLGTFSPANSGPLPCPVAGAFAAFDEATLDERYPRHGRYVRQVAHAAWRLVRDGLLLPRDAVIYLREAARSAVGR